MIYSFILTFILYHRSKKILKILYNYWRFGLFQWEIHGKIIVRIRTCDQLVDSIRKWNVRMYPSKWCIQLNMDVSNVGWVSCLWDQFVSFWVLIFYQYTFRYRWWTSCGRHRRPYVSIPSQGEYKYINSLRKLFYISSLVRHQVLKWNLCLVFQMKNQPKRKKQVLKVS